MFKTKLAICSYLYEDQNPSPSPYFPLAVPNIRYISSVPVWIYNRWPTYIIIGREIDHRKLLIHRLTAQCTQLSDGTHYKLKSLTDMLCQIWETHKLYLRSTLRYGRGIWQVSSQCTGMLGTSTLYCILCGVSFTVKYTLHSEHCLFYWEKKVDKKW